MALVFDTLICTVMKTNTGVHACFPPCLVPFISGCWIVRNVETTTAFCSLFKIYQQLGINPMLYFMFLYSVHLYVLPMYAQND